MSNGENEVDSDSLSAITRKVEEHVIRNAWKEEERAQKVLIILKARDKKIFELEKKIAQLESGIIDKETLCLSPSVSKYRHKSIGKEKYQSDLSVTKSLDNVSSSRPSQSTVTVQEMSVPCLKLTTSFKPDSENHTVSEKFCDGDSNEIYNSTLNNNFGCWGSLLTEVSGAIVARRLNITTEDFPPYSWAEMNADTRHCPGRIGNSWCQPMMQKVEDTIFRSSMQETHHSPVGGLSNKSNDPSGEFDSQLISPRVFRRRAHSIVEINEEKNSLSTNEKRSEVPVEIPQKASSLLRTMCYLLWKKAKNSKRFVRYSKCRQKIHRAKSTESKLRQQLLKTSPRLIRKNTQVKYLRAEFKRLKNTMLTAESNLNYLSNSLEIGNHNEKKDEFSTLQLENIEICRNSRELQKKLEEDAAIIAQLRKRLFKLESANISKKNLLDNYKCQLREFQKEKSELVMKNNKFESKISILESTIAKLKISLELEHRRYSELKSQGEIKLKSSQCEQSMLDEMNIENNKHYDIAQTSYSKLIASRSTNIEYLSAITDFLRRINAYQRERNAEKDLDHSEASRREAHNVACAILNITPIELSGILEGHSSNNINQWISDVEAITRQASFRRKLSKFLFKKVVNSDY